MWHLADIVDCSDGRFAPEADVRSGLPKVKFADFELISRSRTVANSVVHRNDMANVTTELLRGLFPLKKSVRLLGVSVSGFVGEETDDPAQIALEF